MSWDIYGNPLQRGHCEVHPHVAEEYPCSVCLYEREQHKDATRQCPDCNESEHYLGQAQEHIKELERQRNDLLAALEAFREVGGTEVGGRGMSKYKMVPMEPTIDMVIAGEDAWDTQLDKRLFAKDNGEAFATYPSEETHELCSRVAYRAMLAAAPAVQVEPVGWHTEDHLDDKSATTYSAEVAQRWCAKGWPVTPLYTAPQPAEQPECGCCGQTVKCDDDCDAVVIGGHRTAEQQPAPEVAMLVAALEKARDAIASLPKDALGNVPDTQQCQGWHIRDELINDISTALATYRNQGGAI